MTIDAFFYFALLALWSGLVAYYVLFVALSGFFRTKGTRPAHSTHHAPAKHHASHPAPVPHHPAPKSPMRGRFSAHEGFKSFARDVELTVEDIVHGLARDE